MGKNPLPPGYRFHPTDVELIRYWLKKRVLGKKLRRPVPIADVDIYKFAPWDLRNKSCLKSGDLIWYFFCPRGRKYASGFRTNRSTDVGFWKKTGNDRPVHYKSKVIGNVKTLVFHTGKAPKGDRTDWVMHEYQLEDKELSDKGVVQDSYVLCAIFKKDEFGPRNGAQYGAPFNEEDWDDDTDDNLEIYSKEDIPSDAIAGPSTALPSVLNNSVITSSYMTETVFIGPSSSHPSDSCVSAYRSSMVIDDAFVATNTPAVACEDVNPVVPLVPAIPRKVNSFTDLTAPKVAVGEDNFGALLAPKAATEEIASTVAMLSPHVSEEDDVSAMLAAFVDEGTFNPSGNQEVAVISGENDRTDMQMLNNSSNYGSNLGLAYYTNDADICGSSENLENLNGQSPYYGDQFLELDDIVDDGNKQASQDNKGENAESSPN